MASPQVLVDKGNTQVDGTVVHTDARLAAKAEINAQIADLNKQDKAPGLRSRSAKSQLLDTTKYDRAHPAWHHRFVNIKNPDKMSERLADGFVEVPRPDPKATSPSADAYGVRLGDDYVLMRQPRAYYQARVRQQDELTRARERAHVDEVQGVAEAVIRQLRGQGFKISRDHVVINEGT